MSHGDGLAHIRGVNLVYSVQVIAGFEDNVCLYGFEAAFAVLEIPQPLGLCKKLVGEILWLLELGAVRHTERSVATGYTEGFDQQGRAESVAALGHVLEEVVLVDGPEDGILVEKVRNSYDTSWSSFVRLVHFDALTFHRYDPQLLQRERAFDRRWCRIVPCCYFETSHVEGRCGNGHLIYLAKIWIVWSGQERRGSRAVRELALPLRLWHQSELSNRLASSVFRSVSVTLSPWRMRRRIVRASASLLDRNRSISLSCGNCLSWEVAVLLL